MIEVLKSKIHRAVVTDANINYEGSITLSSSLIRKAGLVKYEKVLVVDINNANRFETYVLESDVENTVCLNGAAARLVSVGDLIIIMSFRHIDEASAYDYEPTVVILNEKNEAI